MKRTLKIGDKLKCLQDRIYEGSRCFTKGNSYIIIGLEEGYVFFIDDVGDEFHFSVNFLGQYFIDLFIFGR